MALLDIVITHAHEPWGIGRKMFEMLKVQRGVEEGDCRVILVQDGPDDQLDTARILKQYPFVETLVEQPKGGVSAVRNAGLEESDAEWIMFCDFDDCLYSVDSLYRIIQSLREAGDKADLVYSDFWIEQRTPEGRFTKVLKGWNTVFIHGKVYRRQFLLDHGIRFDEELTYSEDAMFNALVAMEVDASRVAVMPEVVYMWCFRTESLSNYTGGDGTRNMSLYRKRIKVCEEYEKRGRIYDTRAAAARALLDYYWEMNGDVEMAGGTVEEWEERIREFCRRWPKAMLAISPEDRKKLYDVTKEEAARKRLIHDGITMPRPEDWLRRIGAI